MSMSQDNQDFTSLQRLLALKRYEQPPPGYFHNFSGQVIARIKAGEGAHDSAFERLFLDAPWLQRLWGLLETKPIMAGAFGTAVCALLVSGVVYSERPENPSTLAGFPAATVVPVAVANSGVIAEPAMPAGFARFSQESGVSDSMSPSSAAEGIFGLVPKPMVMPASFTSPAN